MKISYWDQFIHTLNMQSREIKAGWKIVFMILLGISKLLKKQTKKNWIMTSFISDDEYSS